MWKFIKELYLQYTSQTLNLRKLHIDFEIGAHEAVKEVFPNVQLIGCLFHLSQFWWRYIRQDIRMIRVYHTIILGKWLKMFFGLPILPYKIVKNGFVKLVGYCPDEDWLEFSDHKLNNYMQPNLIFPTNLRAEEPLINKRTINDPESFHRTFNIQLYSAHPPTHIHILILYLYFVIESLKEMLVETKSQWEEDLTVVGPEKDYCRMSLKWTSINAKCDNGEG
ncbi:Hypothetical protein CINCED_3A019562 [Cinara cedri]|uniref:Uncharacterized protein n=1 Tax=Cinara cedri TaxID=506608 RepID=A0A5E4M271_9HEMI|nr:Hypothetical protein CINCED_3A019562 [Cinara cedri]